MSAQHVVIVGAGQAGARCALALREFGHTGTVTLIGDEAHAPYERPPLSKALLGPDAATTRVHLHELQHYADAQVDVRLAQRVGALDVKVQQLTLADGSTVHYDCCVLATGGRARAWPGTLDGDGARILSLRNLDDAHTLRTRLAGARRIAVIGGGFLGLECADAAAALGLEVTVIEAADRLLPGRMPAALSPLLRKRHAARGVRFELGARIERIVDRAAAPHARIELMNGEAVEADLCLIAIGQTPNDTLAKDSGIETGNGIHVDAHCRTSAPNVLATGDCASFPFGPSGRRVRLESWQNAEQQSRVAAATALGLDAAYAPLPWFWTDQTGWNMQFLGLQDPAEAEPDWLMRESGATPGERSVWFGMRGDTLVAAVAINSGGDMQPLRKLIEKGAPLDHATLLDPAIKLAKLAKALSQGEGARPMTRI